MENRADEVIKDDVFYMKSLVGKKVKIQTIENKVFEGILYVIDPVYKTVILCDDTKIRLFIHLSIKSLELISQEVINDSFLQHSVQKNVKEWQNVNTRKEILLKWLKHMYINVKEEGENLKVEGHLMIGPPYTQDSCYCDNVVILEKIQSIMNLMPADFK